ncbi:MAG: hypothetical protein QXX99_01080 [Candidatus Bathyarchaeia archaeon]
MFAERKILIVILKNTQEEANAEIENICREARVPRAIVLDTLNRLYESGLLRIERDKVFVDGEQRLKIAVKSINLGSDVERVARFLTWSEFEQFSKALLKLNDFTVITNFRFKWLGKRWEIDMVGARKPIIVSADCKHWRSRWSGSASFKAAKSQAERTKALAETSRHIRSRIGISGWEYAYFVPVILSLHPSQCKFYEGTPIVPILQLNDFLQNLIVNLNEVNHFYISYT